MALKLTSKLIPDAVPSVILGTAACLALLAVVSGCTSTFTSPYKVHGIRVDRPVFDIYAMKLADSTIRLSFVADARMRTDDPIIRWVDAAIGPDADHLTDTVTFSVSHSGEVGLTESVIVGEATWDTKAAKLASEAVTDVGVVTGSNHIVFRQQLKFTPAQALEMQPFSRRRPDGNADLGVMAKRLFSVSGEYLPSSENFRVIISDKKGNVTWRSDADMNFMMAVGTVQPQNVNAIRQFVTTWNGKNQQGQPVPDGEYNVEFVIPARPNPYVSRTTITWPVR